MEHILTERCKLTLLNEADFNELIPLYTNEDVRKYLGGVRTSNQALETLKQAMQANGEYNFTVRLNTDEAIGLLMVAPHHDAKDMEISYMFLPQYWGMGYAKETVQVMLNFCKSKLKLARVVSETQAANENSCRLLEALGYKIEEELERFEAQQRLYIYDFAEHFLKECETFFLATAADNAPAVRPFGAVMEHKGELYFSTASTKAVYNQLKANPQVQIVALKASTREWIRINGNAIEVYDLDIKQKMLDVCPVLLKHFNSRSCTPFALFKFTEMEVKFYP